MDKSERISFGNNVLKKHLPKPIIDYENVNPHVSARSADYVLEIPRRSLQPIIRKQGMRPIRGSAIFETAWWCKKRRLL